MNVFCSGANRGIGLGLVRHLLDTPDVKRVFAGVRKPEDADVFNKY
jgi:NAD(P)-dependent dehydrogenase (short-subunit alcohol dehydrogenase family)